MEYEEAFELFQDIIGQKQGKLMSERCSNPEQARMQTLKVNTLQDLWLDIEKLKTHSKSVIEEER